ncbi:extracellular calcium-sensing receptor isoform X2 [Hydra vulgaris]|uniref:Extracellular calcium-sensing receptor isoform X2 n=1 Tax=Hydra vulgaris TaxID=6087 RepID=A0ABM4B157_HYDVU
MKLFVQYDLLNRNLVYESSRINSNLIILNCKLISYERKVQKRGGGIMTYIHNDVTTKIRDDLSVSDADDNIEYSNKNTIAEKINEFFVNIGPNIALKIKSPNISFKSYLSDAQSEIKYKELNYQELNVALKLNKTPGIDDICSRIVANAFTTINRPIFEIFKSSIRTEVVSDKLTVAKVVPIFKTEYLILFVFGFSYCDKCMDNRVKSFVSATFKISGLFPMGCFSASDIDNRTIAWMEALNYTVNQENKRCNKSIFEFVIYDTYNTTNMDMTTFAVLDSLLYSSINKNTDKVVNSCDINVKSCDTNNSTCESCSNIYKQEHINTILGFVGPAESSNSIYVNELTSSYKSIPVVSYAATSLELNNRISYPNFFRTVSSGDHQAEFITDLIKKINSNLVSILWVDSSYGRDGGEQQIISFKKNGICIDYKDKLPNNYNPDKYSQIATNLTASNAKVIVFWGTFSPFQNLLTNTSAQNLTDKTWILSEAVGKNPFFLDNKNIFNNKIFLVVQTDGEDTEFKSHFYSQTYQNSSPWLKAVFKKHGVNESTQNFTVKNIFEVFDLSKVLFVQNAVKVLTRSFFLYQEKLGANFNTCEFQMINNRTMFLEIIKQISFLTSNESKIFSFDSTHNPQSAFFELYSSKFNLVALWSNKNTTNKARLEIKNSDLISYIYSVCSNSCSFGEIKENVSDSTCCWKCVPCPKYSEDKNCYKLERLYWNFKRNKLLAHQLIVLLFSAIGATTSIVFILTFVKMKSTLIVRSSNYEMSLIQMIMHLVMFILPLLAFGEEAEVKCITRIYLSSFLHVAIVTIVLAKVKRLVAVFSLDIHCKISKKEMFFLRSKIGVLLLIFPCIFVTLIFVAQNSKFKIYVSDDIDTVEKYCDSGNFLVIYVCYVIALSLLCGFQSFKARNLPWKYNENVYIAYSLFLSNITMCIMLGLIQSNFDSSNKKFSYCLLTNIANLFLITILFSNKIKIIWMNPDKNSRAEFYRNRFESKHSSISTSSIVVNQSHASTDAIFFASEDEVSLKSLNAISYANLNEDSISNTNIVSQAPCITYI